MDALSDLEGLLNCLKEPAILLGLDYRILVANAAYRETYEWRPDRDRRHCYEASHGYAAPCDLAGESCPLKQSLGTGQNSRVLHIHHTPRGKEYVNVEMWPVKDPHTGAIKYFLERMQPSAAATIEAADNKLVGSAPAFQRMLALVERAARSSTTIMLLGDTGTGKELVAQTIHELSDRSDKPFVPVECTGLPESLFESELFGYEKGAFTGALSKRGGLVDAASGGTLFLDEVGEIPLAEQVKLLRLLETKRYRPVGGSEWKEADFRLVCATHRSLRQMVSAGTFREDLYYRLNVFEIELPPLRQRIGDLDALIASILARLSASHVTVSPDAMRALQRYDFPGNIRELRNIIERALLLADDDVIGLEHLPDSVRQASATVSAQTDEEIVSLAEAEQRYLRRLLATTDLDRRQLAEKLGISERALYRKLANLRR
jgi:two-component system response regulator HydG